MIKPNIPININISSYQDMYIQKYLYTPVASSSGVSSSLNSSTVNSSLSKISSNLSEEPGNSGYNRSNNNNNKKETIDHYEKLLKCETY